MKNGPVRSGFRGYATHHDFGGYKIPVPVQNLVMRDYTQRKNLLFKLTVNEYYFPNCTLQLDSLVGQLPSLEGVIMCSLFMLPGDERKRRSLYEAFFKEKAELHMIFEDVVLKTPQDAEYVENIIKLNDMLRNCPKSIPRELLPSLNGQDFFSCAPC